MSKTQNPIRIVLEEVLGGAGFSRKGDSWYRRAEEVLEVVNLQKSQYGDQYFLNYAIWLYALGEATFPKEEKCHVRMRVDALMKNKEDLARLLDLDAPIPDTERHVAASNLLTDEFLSFANNNRSLANLSATFNAGKLSKAMVLISARKILSGNLSASPGDG